MNKRTIPTRAETQRILSTLTGLDIIVKNAEQAKEPNQDVFYIGTYCSANDDICVLVRTDLNLSASCAALLTRFMSGTAKEAIDAKKLDEDLFSNLYEVMNVLGGKLNAEDVEHVRFKNTFHRDDLPKTVTALLNKEPSERADYEISIPNYFDGVLTYYIYK